MDRLVWTPREVVDVDGPRALLRAYFEQSAVRTLLLSVCPPEPNANTAACDVGCGFGRMTPVLTEFAGRVAGFEREPELLAIARRLQPAIDFRGIDALTTLPAQTATFDIALVFTVLQHVPEPAVRAVVSEVQRILKPTGVLLLCEETDPTLEAGDRAQAHLGYTCGRPVETYASWLSPWTLAASRRRIIEPDYPRADVGTYMLFRKEKDEGGRMKNLLDLFFRPSSFFLRPSSFPRTPAR